MMWNSTGTPIQEVLKVFKNMGKISLGFLVSLKNAERGILPQYGSLWHLFPYAKSPTTTAPPLCSCPGLLHLLAPAVYFPSQAVPLDASNQT